MGELSSCRWNPPPSELHSAKPFSLSRVDGDRARIRPSLLLTAPKLQTQRGVADPPSSSAILSPVGRNASSFSRARRVETRQRNASKSPVVFDFGRWLFLSSGLRSCSPVLLLRAPVSARGRVSSACRVLPVGHLSARLSEAPFRYLFSCPMSHIFMPMNVILDKLAAEKKGRRSSCHIRSAFSVVLDYTVSCHQAFLNAGMSRS